MSKQKNMTGQIATLKKVMHYLKHYIPILILSVVLATVTVALTLYFPILTGRAIDLILDKGNVDFPGILAIAKEGAIVIGITAAAQWIMNMCNNRMTYNIVRDIRRDAFERIEHLPLSYIDSHSHGDMVSRIIADVDTFADGLLMGFTQLFTGLATIIGTLLFMLFVNVKITVVVVLLTPISLFVAGFIAKKTYSMFQLQTQTRGEQTALIEEMVGNQKVVQAFCHEKEALGQFADVNDRLQKYSLRATFFSSLVNPSTRFVNSLVYAAVGITGALAVILTGGAFSVGNLSCFLSYANQYTKPFNEISGVVAELQNAVASAKRVFAVIDEPAESDDSHLPELEHCDGTMQLSHVKFSYVPDRKLITDFNLDVHCGQRIAIVGPTGCGKTTLINLLLRFYDVDGGEISIAGQNIAAVTRDSLRACYGMVLQETWLFTGTVAENIAYSRPDATREEIVAAAKAAYADGFIRRLPKGYDTVLTEDGSGLSQGQKQLLCIARIMLTDPPFLILDEATSSIDLRTEQRIQKAFEKLMAGKTSFIIAHRLSTIKSADWILVMNQGNVLEQGTHDSLMEQNGFYANLYQSQFADSEKAE
jgi:ATP-binding cassette subfamily B multidrug efflux pump